MRLRTTALPGVLSVLVLFLLSAPPVAASEDAESHRIPLERWLALDPIALHAPAAPSDAEPVEPAALAKARRLAVKDLTPARDETLTLPEGRTVTWHPISAKGGRLPDVAPPSGASGMLAYRATYLTTDRFVDARLHVDSPHSVHAWIDGEWVRCETEEGIPVPLRTGKHPLWLEITRASDAEEAEQLATIALDVGSSEANVRMSTDPAHRLRLDDLLEVEDASGVRLSHDGSRLAVDLSDPAVPAESRRRWQEIWDPATGRKVRDSGTTSWKQMRWAPDGARFAYVVDEDDRGVAVWIDEEGSARKVVEGVPGLAGLTWAPDGRSLLYAAEVDNGEGGAQEDQEELARRIESLADRREELQKIKQLFQVNTRSGARRQLTAGDRSAQLQDVDPDGTELIFTRTVYHEDRRPFESTAIWQLSLGSLEARELATVPFGASVRYAPDGSGLLVKAAPSAFDRAGTTLGSNRIPNAYDEQIYLLEPDSGQVSPLSRDFAPAISEMKVPSTGRHVYLRVVEGPTHRLYRYDLSARRFEPLKTRLETIDSFSVARDGSRIAWIGSSADLPPRVVSSVVPEAASWSPEVVRVPAPEREPHLKLGAVEEWDFETEEGTRLDGRIYLPPGFDSQETYPAIVYYYGGMMPVTRDFGGRYPKNFWAAQGYVVYVLQPSGAIGYGQESSARHVNDWGRRVAGEIIAATKGFLETHAFVDPDRVGCIGASYGGFMTQLLVTKTDIFDAAVSHAGISSISSYWGEGHWGYLYNAVSAARSYPWNSPEIYIELSPLFHADAITTPLLLLHGAADPNVPPGESRQMFTALRVLGKPVELIEIPGEPHWILQLDKRRLWSETIVAWFDRELRDRPAYWNHLYAGEEESRQK